MLSEDDFQRLRTENELLMIRLLDLDSLISAREGELEMLRKMAEEGRQLRSSLDNGLVEMDQMRQALDLAGRKAEGIENLREATENELIGCLRNEGKYLELLNKSGSLHAEIEVLQNELSDAAVFNDKIRSLESRLAELASKLEIAEMDRDYLIKELEDIRARRFSDAALRGDFPKNPNM